MDAHVRGARGPLAAVAAGVLLLMTVLPALLRPAQFLQDDSYFYLQIAHNIAAGQGSTFHGITPTNGYHPLWMVGAVAATWLADGDKTATLQVAVAIQVLLAIGVALLFVQFARRMGLDYRLAGLAVILSYLFGTGIYGSEAHLNALLLMAGMLSLWHALERDRPWQWFATGVLLGLAVLARLDNIFAAATLCMLGALHDRNHGVARIASRAALAALGGALVVLPYLALNWVQYGHLMPISGAIKSTFPAFNFEFGRLGAMGKLAAPFGLVALAIGLFLDRDHRRRVLWCGLGAGVIAHALYVVGFTDHYTFWAWYYVSGVLAAGLSAAFLPGWLADRLGPHWAGAGVRPLAIVVTFAILSVGAARAWLKAFSPMVLGPVTIDVPVNEYRWPEEFGAWMKGNLPADSVVFVLDWPGALAWYSDLRILPMDGLVNDFQYNDDLLSAGARNYLCAHGVTHFFGLMDDGRATREITVPAPLYRKPAGTLLLREEQLLVKVPDVVSRPDEALPFFVWRVDCPPG